MTRPHLTQTGLVWLPVRAILDPEDFAPMPEARILVVDDVPQNVRLLEAILAPRGYDVLAATSGLQALEMIAHDGPDLVLLDVVMPGIDGYEVCRRIREDPSTAMLPVVMVTAAQEQEKVRAIEAGADDFISKPLNAGELLARVRSLLRVKQYHDKIQAQTGELAEWNASLEARVQAQVDMLQRFERVRRFVSPELAEVILSSGGEDLLQSHRREITVVFCDLRGFTAFAETAEPEEVIGVLRAFHQAMGEVIYRHEGTLERFAGDGLMVFFNDPLPCPDPAQRAVCMAVEMRERATDLCREWVRRGYDLAFGVGVAQGFATLGQVGFEGRWDYAAIGTVTNLASRLCDEAAPGQILVSQRIGAEVERLVEVDPVGPLSLKGFSRPIPAFNVVRVLDPTGG